MSLVECPECTREVSSYAKACPGCGFPVFEALQETVNDLTGSSQARSIRQVSAAHNIERWAERYSEELDPEVVEAEARRKRSDRLTKIVLGTFALLVVALQLIWVYSAFVQ